MWVRPASSEITLQWRQGGEARNHPSSSPSLGLSPDPLVRALGGPTKGYSQGLLCRAGPATGVACVATKNHSRASALLPSWCMSGAYKSKPPPTVPIGRHHWQFPLLWTRSALAGLHPMGGSHLPWLCQPEPLCLDPCCIQLQLGIATSTGGPIISVPPVVSTSHVQESPCAQDTRRRVEQQPLMARDAL